MIRIEPSVNEKCKMKNDKEKLKKLGGLTTASPWTRFGGWAVDFLLWTMVWLGLAWLVVSAGEVTKLLDSLLWAAVGLGSLGTLGNLVATAGFTHWFGGTIGKLVFGMEVVDERENRLSFWRAIWREWFGKMVSGMALWLGFIWIFIDKERPAESSNIQAGRRGWHDMMAGSRVVVKRPGFLPVGILIGLVLIITNWLLTAGVLSKVRENFPFYQGVFSEISTAVSENFRKNDSPQAESMDSSKPEDVLPSSTPTVAVLPPPQIRLSGSPAPTKKPTTSGETTLLVTAVKEGGQPVENAHLILRNAEDLSFIGEGYTDRYGNFGFGKLTATSYRIQAGLGNDLSFQKTASVTLGQANTATVELLYNTGGKITGSVRFSDGSPIAGVELKAKKGELCPGFNQSGDAKTDDSGRYELSVSGPGDYCVAVTKMNWGSVNTSNSNDFTKGVHIDAGGSAGADFSLPRK